MSQPLSYIALGSNLGPRTETLHRAINMLDQQSGVSVQAVSEFYETSPEGGPAGQPMYLNGAVAISTEQSPVELLSMLHQIEQSLGRDRDREGRWGSRTCDLDIIMMGDLVLNTDRLTIPHPRMRERLFVLEPLAEIAPDVVDPVTMKTVVQLLSTLKSGEKSGE